MSSQKQIRNLVKQVRDNLTPDLLKPGYGRDDNPIAGHCYVATESLYHLLGGKESGWFPVRLRMPDSDVHWWLENSDGEVLDATHDQFSHEIPYDEGRPGGFLTREPSKRAQELMTRVKHNTMAESLPPDDVTASAENPQLVLQNVELGKQYLSWKGELRYHVSAQDTIYNVIDQDPEYYQEYGTYKIIGSINYVEFDYGKPDHELYVDQVYVDPEYRKTNAFWMLVKPILDTGLPINATFMNKQLQRIFERLQSRGEIKVHPLYVGSRQSHVEVVDGPWSFHGGGFPFFFFPDDNMLFLMPHETYHIDLRHAMPLEYQQELRNYTKDDLDRVSYVAGRIDFAKESPDEPPIPVVDVYRGSPDWQEIIEQMVVEGVANGDIPNDLSNDEFEKWVDSDEPTPEPETRGTLGEVYDLPEHPFDTLGGYEQQKEAAMLVEELESKTSMAERTGDPTLDKLIDTFINTSSEELGDSPLHEWLTDPEEAQGMCSLVSAEFAQFIREQGFDAYDAGEDAGVDDDYYRTRWPERFDKNPMYQTEYTPNDWGYSDRTRTKGDEYYPQHSATIVHMPTGTFMVDFTSAQYGYKEFPMVQRLNDAGSWDRQWTSKTAKIVTLPNIFEPHNNGNDQRATFVYLVPTNTFYVAPNNAYHTDIWNWLYAHREEEYNQLFSRKFKDAFKEGTVALGLIEHDWEDRALNCRLYWAEGNETLPPHIMEELSNYFGEKVYQRPWKYPHEPNINSPEYWYGPEEEEEPTQQWPTNSLEAKWKLSFDPSTVNWREKRIEIVTLAAQYGVMINWVAGMALEDAVGWPDIDQIDLSKRFDSDLAYAIALHEIGHFAFSKEFERLPSIDPDGNIGTHEEELWVDHWMLEHATIPISQSTLEAVKNAFDTYERILPTPAPGYGWMMQPKQSTYELDPQQIPALKKHVEQMAAENGIHVEWRDQPWFANTFFQGVHVPTGQIFPGAAYCADLKTDADLFAAMHEVAHGIFKKTFGGISGGSSVEEEMWVNHWALEHSPVVFDQATLEKMKVNLDQYMNIHVHHPWRGIYLQSPSNPGWLQNADPDPHAPSADDLYTPEEWQAYRKHKKEQRQHYNDNFLPLKHRSAIVRWVDANEPTGDEGYGGDDRFACIYDETTDMLYISTETDVVHRDLCRAIPEYAAAANGRKWLRALDFLDYGGIHIDPYHPDESFWVSYHGEMPEDDMNKLMEILQASEYKKLQDELRQAGSLMPYRYIILKDGTEINDAGDGSIGSHRDLAKRNGIRWKTVQDLGFYDPSEPTGRYGLKERARDRGKIYDERVRLWYEKAFDDDKPPQTLIGKTSVNLPGVEWVDTEGETFHGDGVPFIYVPEHDAVYVGTTQTGHRKLIKRNEDLNGFIHPEEYGPTKRMTGIIPGRIDYKGNAGFYQVGKPYAPEHVDRATELLQSAWPYMEGRDAWDEDRRVFEDDDYSFLRKLTKTSALIQVPAGNDKFADMGIAFLYWKGDLYYCQGHHPDIFSYVKRTDGRYFADQPAYKEMREDAKDGSAVFGWMTLHQGLWADSPAYKTHNGLLIFFSTGNMKAINMFTSQQTKDEAATLIDANDEVFLEMVSDKTDRPWLLESNSWIHPDDGRDKREFLPGDIRNSIAYALIVEQVVKDVDELRQWYYEKQHTSKTASNVMFHVAPTAARSSIAQYGLNWQRRDKRNDWRQDEDEELYPHGNYLTTSLEKAKEYQRIINGGGQIYQVDATGLNLIRDVDEDYEGTAYYTTGAIEPSRITLLDHTSKVAFPDNVPEQLQLRDMQRGDESAPYSNRLTNEQGIVAYVGDEQVGHVTYSIEPEGQYLHDRAPMSGDYPRADRDYTYVHWLYVEPEWRQQGISRILLDAVRERTGNPMRGDLQSEHVRGVQDSKTAALFSKLVDWLQQRFYMSYEDAEAIASDMHGAGYADFLDPHEELLPLVYEIAEKYGIELHDPYDVDAPLNAAEQWKIDHKDDPRYTKTAAAEILIDTVSAYPSEGPVILDNDGIVWFGRGYSSHETLQEEVDKLDGGYEVARAEIIQDDYVPQPNLKGYPTLEQDDRMFNELRDAGVLIKRRLKDKSLTELYSGGFLNPQVEGTTHETWSFTPYISLPPPIANVQPPITFTRTSQGLTGRNPCDSNESTHDLTQESMHDRGRTAPLNHEPRPYSPRKEDPHQTGLPRVPPVVSGTSICPTETTWDFSSITIAGETEGELPLMSDEARNSLRAKFPGFKLIYVPTSDEESRYNWLWNNGAESYTTQKAVYFNPYLKMFCIGSPGYHHSDLMRGMRRDGITEARLTSEAREEGWIYGYIDGDDGPGLHGRGLENYLRTLPDTLDISSEGSASENVPDEEDNVRYSEVIDLNQFGDVRDVRTRYRAIAFASDGNNIYIGGNHPAIIKAVLGDFKDKQLIKNNWVFGWADRIGPDDAWIVDMTSGNYSWINSMHQEHLERTKRFMEQYLNGTHEAAMFQDDTPQNDAISEAIPQLAEHLNAHGYKQQDFAYCVMPDGTAYISMGDIATHQDMMKFFKREQGYTKADFKQWRWGYITVYNTNQGTIDSGSWSMPTKVRTPATSFQFLSRVSYPVPQVQEVNTGTSGEHGRPFLYDYNKGIVYLGSEHSMHQDLYRELHRIQNFTREEIKSLLIGAINDWQAFPSRNGWYFQHERLWSPEQEQAVREALDPYTTTQPELGSDPPWLPDDQENPFEFKSSAMAPMNVRWVGHPSRSSAIWCWHIPSNTLILAPWFSVYHSDIIRELEPNVRFKDAIRKFLLGNLNLNEDGSVEVTDRKDQPLANREVADAVAKAFMANREARISMHFQYLPESEAPFRDAGAPFVITHDGELIVGNENHTDHRGLMESVGRRSRDIETAGILFPDGHYTVLRGSGRGSSDPGLDWILDELPDDWWETGYNLEPKSLPEPDFDWYTD